MPFIVDFSNYLTEHGLFPGVPPLSIVHDDFLSAASNGNAGLAAHLGESFAYYALLAAPSLRSAKAIARASHVEVVLAASVGSAVTSAEIAAVEVYLRARLVPAQAAALVVVPAANRQITPAGEVFYYSSFQLVQAQTAIVEALAAIACPIGGSELNTASGKVNGITRTEFIVAIQSAKILGEKCVKACGLSLPDEVTALGESEVAVIVPVFDQTHLIMTPVTPEA